MIVLKRNFSKNKIANKLRLTGWKLYVKLYFLIR